MAIGQLYDYRRFVREAKNFAILVPTPLRPDLAEFVKACNVTVISPDESGDFALEP
jgi:hypothetical protein